MSLTATGAGYMSLFIMVLELFIKFVAIYTMFMVAKALRIYIKKNS